VSTASFATAARKSQHRSYDAPRGCQGKSDHEVNFREHVRTVSKRPTTRESGVPIWHSGLGDVARFHRGIQPRHDDRVLDYLGDGWGVSSPPEETTRRSHDEMGAVAKLKPGGQAQRQGVGHQRRPLD